MQNGLTTILLVAVILGIDAFSLSLGMSLGKTSRKFEFKLAGIIGLFHIMMPLLGLNIGLLAGEILGKCAKFLGVLVLFYISGDFIIKGYEQTRTGVYKISQRAEIFPDNRVIASKDWSKVFLLGLTVSIDALTVGFSLGTFNVSVLLTAVIIGAVAAIMTLLGFYGGRVFSRFIGNYAQILGGVMLLILAFKMLFSTLLGG